ncbi:MAG: PIN domain-containing protein [Chloroflexi bacterium]|nr:MAG: PIN domain-containing protein [Chloroflexota bacterium]
MSAAVFVLDASLTLAWCFEDEYAQKADEILDLLGQSQAIVPSLWLLEVSNVLLGAERRGRLTVAEGMRFLELLRSLPIEVVDTPLNRAWGEVHNLARDHRLSSYDANYLDLAIRSGAPLATLDDDLRRAALACGVKLI